MKRELIFYDYGGEVLGRTGEITAIYLKEYYNAVGTFEVRLTASAGKVLLENDFVIAAGDGFKAIITSVTVDEGGVIACGRTLNWILGRRLCAPFGSVKDENGETVTVTFGSGKNRRERRFRGVGGLHIGQCVGNNRI